MIAGIKKTGFLTTLIPVAVLLLGLNGTCMESSKMPQSDKSTGKKTAEKLTPESIRRGNNEFSCDLYKALKKNSGNLFFSPYSISTALAMTYAGARGKTAEEMACVLHFNSDQNRFHTSFIEHWRTLADIQKKGSVQLTLANSLWLHKGYKYLQPFLDLTREKYGAGFFTVNFAESDAVRKEINLWVQNNTEQKIQNLIRPGIITPLTRLVLTNAIYFKGSWKSRFNPSLTKNGTFRLDSENTTTVPFMFKEEKCNYMADTALQVLELPYRGEDVSMIILLPKAHHGLPFLESSLSTHTIHRLTQQFTYQKVKIFIPKFKLVSSCELKKVLISMGMSLPFSARADFTGITKKKELYISEIVHKAFVDVNEEGTEAAAATAVTMRKLSAPMPPEVFRADHPFIFLIRENSSGSILFMGRIVNPKNRI